MILLHNPLRIGSGAVFILHSTTQDIVYAIFGVQQGHLTLRNINKIKT